MWIAKAVTWGKSSIMELILFVLCVILAFGADGFFSVDNLLNVLPGALQPISPRAWRRRVWG